MATDFNIGQTTLDWAESNNILCWFQNETTSTNDIAKSNGFKDKAQWLYVTNSQTKGRGRNNNTWTNSKKLGDQLIITWCFNLKKAAQPISSPLFGWAIYKSLKEEFKLNLSIKAPNDIYSSNQKLSGILLESVSQVNQNFICVGIGLNVFSAPSNVKNSTFICDNNSNIIDKNSWYSFLSRLKVNLEEASIMCQSNEISSKIQSEILIGLTNWPSNSVTDVCANGNLILGNGDIIDWMDL